MNNRIKLAAELYVERNKNMVLKSKVSDNIFYHLIDKNAKFDKYGLVSPQYIYDNKIKSLYPLLDLSLSKYADRIVDTWNIEKYKGRDPKSLSREEIMDGIKIFRKDENSLKYIYLFKYPPYFGLGKNMDNILKDKKLIKININNSSVWYIDYGYENSYIGNKKLDFQYYNDISIKDYYKNYKDNNSPIFASLNHISIIWGDGHIPPEYLEEVPIPNKSNIGHLLNK